MNREATATPCHNSFLSLSCVNLLTKVKFCSIRKNCTWRCFFELSGKYMYNFLSAWVWKSEWRRCIGEAFHVCIRPLVWLDTEAAGFLWLIGIAWTCAVACGKMSTGWEVKRPFRHNCRVFFMAFFVRVQDTKPLKTCWWIRLPQTYTQTHG